MKALKIAALVLASGFILTGCSLIKQSDDQGAIAPLNVDTIVMTPSPSSTPSPSTTPKVEDEKTMQKEVEGISIEQDFNVLVK